VVTCKKVEQQQQQHQHQQQQQQLLKFFIKIIKEKTEAFATFIYLSEKNNKLKKFLDIKCQI